MAEPATLTLVGGSLLVMAFRYIARQYRRFKPVLDFAGAAVLLVVLSPVIVLAAALVKLTSRGPAFYRQERVGQDGKVFRMFKIRTMVADAEAKCGPVWARKRDPRVTLVGRILRRTHIDEFPQLINVLRGEMSLVGPRPERPHFVEKLRREIQGYDRRLAVRPGITGLAQVRNGYDVTVEGVKRKLRYDRLYVRKICALLDVRILLATLRKFFVDEYAE